MRKIHRDRSAQRVPNKCRFENAHGGQKFSYRSGVIADGLEAHPFRMTVPGQIQCDDVAPADGRARV